MVGDGGPDQDPTRVVWNGKVKKLATEEEIIFLQFMGLQFFLDLRPAYNLPFTLYKYE